MQLQERFQALLSGAASPQREELATLASHYPMEFRTWAVRWICNGGHGSGALLLLKLLHQKNLLRSLLVNPGAMPLRDAIRLAKLAQHSIANFDWTIADTIREGSETQASRALQILQHLHLSGRVVPGLAAALRTRNVKIRSLVSKLLGRLCDNPSAIQALFEDTDPRVRANAVEGLWGSDHPAARDMLRKSARDSNNRVAANAALGLSKISAVEGTEALRRMSAHADPRFRISAAWCIGQFADPALLPCLETLAADRVPKVGEAARAAMGRALHPGERGPRLMVTVTNTYRTADGGLRLRAFVADGEDNPVDLSVESFRVFQGQAALPGRETRPPARREPLVTILCLADETLTHDVQDTAREGVLTAMHLKRPDDVHCVVGSSVMPMLAFSSDLGQLGDALHLVTPRADPGPDWSESLLRALTLAAARSGCRAVIAFSGGSPLPDPRQAERAKRVVEAAVQSETAVHAVVFTEAEAAPVWAEIASATRGSYRVVRQEDELQDVFWSVFSRISSAYAIAVGPAAEVSAASEGEFRLEVRSAAGYGQARFDPLPPREGV